jgi:thymidylate synthase
VCDLTDGRLPVLTTKKVWLKGVIHELLWMLRGETNVRALKKEGISIWDAWVDSSTAEYDEQGQLIAGECPHIYGKQWRRWDDVRTLLKSEFQSNNTEGYQIIGVTFDSDYYIVRRQIDQIAQIIKTLKINPASRRIILNAWNVSELDTMALHPCHLLAQFYARPLSMEERLAYAEQHDIVASPELISSLRQPPSPDNPIPHFALSCQVYIRSNDIPLGNPWNVPQYGLLTHIIAHLTGMLPERLIVIGGDVHVYQNQWVGVDEQRHREPILESDPRVHIHPDVKDIDQLTANHIQVTGYQSHPAIKFPAAAI